MSEKDNFQSISIREVLDNKAYARFFGGGDGNTTDFYNALYRISESLESHLSPRQTSINLVTLLPAAYRYLQRKYDNFQIPKSNSTTEEILAGLKIILGHDLLKDELSELLTKHINLNVCKPPRYDLLGLLPVFGRDKIKMADIGCGTGNYGAYYLQSDLFIKSANLLRHEKTKLNEIDALNIEYIYGIDVEEFDPLWAHASSISDEPGGDTPHIAKAIEEAERMRNKCSNVYFSVSDPFYYSKDKNNQNRFNVITTFFSIQYSDRPITKWREEVIEPLLETGGYWVCVDRNTATSDNNTYHVILSVKQNNEIKTLGRLCSLERDQFRIKDVDKYLISKLSSN